MKDFVISISIGVLIGTIFAIISNIVEIEKRLDIIEINMKQNEK